MASIYITIRLNFKDTKSFMLILQEIPLISISIRFRLKPFSMLSIILPLSSVSISIWFCKLSKSRSHTFFKKSFISQIITSNPSTKSISFVFNKLAFICLSIIPILDTPSMNCILLPISCVSVPLLNLN